MVFVSTNGWAKSATIYFDPGRHRALRVKAVQTDQSVSDVVKIGRRHEVYR